MIPVNFQKLTPLDTLKMDLRRFFASNGININSLSQIVGGVINLGMHGI